MKVVPLVLVALLLASPLAIVALDAMGVGPAFEASPPEWESGYTWTWDVTGRGRAIGEGFGVIRYESDELQMDATRRAEVLNTTIQQQDQPVDLLLEAFRVDQVRHGDEVMFSGGEGSGDAEETDFTDTFFCITPCGTFLTTYDTDANPSFGAHPFRMFETDGVQLFDFPLTRGKTWTVVSVQDEGMQLEIVAKAIDHEYVDLPGLGPMPTVRVEAALTEASKEAIKQLVRQEAEREGIKVDLDFDLRATYWYAPEVQNLVKLDLDGFITGRASAYGAAGGGRIDFHVDQVLREFSLDAKPERTVEEAQALAGVTLAARGAAPSPSPESFDFQVGASTLATRAGSDEAVGFGLVTGDARHQADETAQTAFGTPPEGAQVRWVHEAPTAEGRVTTIAEGTQTEFTFDGPGLHVVRAETYDLQGRLMGTDQIIIEAYTKERGTIGAGDAGPGAHHLLSALYVAPGARSGVITLESDAVARGTLVIGGGSEEQRASTEMVRSSAEVPFGDLSSGVRPISWEDEVRAGALSATIEVRYDRSMPSGSVAPPTEGSGWNLMDLLGV